MHPRERADARQASDFLSKKVEPDHRKGVETQDYSERASDNFVVSILQNPIQYTVSHAKRDCLFPQVHDYEHLGDIRIIRINGVRLSLVKGKIQVYKCVCEVKVSTPIRHCNTRHQANPTAFILCCHAVTD